MRYIDLGCHSRRDNDLGRGGIVFWDDTLCNGTSFSLHTMDTGRDRIAHDILKKVVERWIIERARLEKSRGQRVSEAAWNNRQSKHEHNDQSGGDIVFRELRPNLTKRNCYGTMLAPEI